MGRRMLNTIIKLLVISALITGLFYYWVDIGGASKNEAVHQLLNDADKAADDFIGRFDGRIEEE